MSRVHELLGVAKPGHCCIAEIGFQRVVQVGFCGDNLRFLGFLLIISISSERIVGFRNERFGSFLVYEYACIIWSGIHLGESFVLRRARIQLLLLLVLFGYGGDLGWHFGRLISFSYKSIFLHEHLNTLLLIYHFLLIVHHLNSFSPFMHLLQLARYRNSFAS